MAKYSRSMNLISPRSLPSRSGRINAYDAHLSFVANTDFAAEKYCTKRRVPSKSGASVNIGSEGQTHRCKYKNSRFT